MEEMMVTMATTTKTLMRKAQRLAEMGTMQMTLLSQRVFQPLQLMESMDHPLVCLDPIVGVPPYFQGESVLCYWLPGLFSSRLLRYLRGLLLHHHPIIFLLLPVSL